MVMYIFSKQLVFYTMTGEAFLLCCAVNNLSSTNKTGCTQILLIHVWTQAIWSTHIARRNRRELFIEKIDVSPSADRRKNCDGDRRPLPPLLIGLLGGLLPFRRRTDGVVGKIFPKKEAACSFHDRPRPILPKFETGKGQNCRLY